MNSDALLQLIRQREPFVDFIRSRHMPPPQKWLLLNVHRFMMEWIDECEHTQRIRESYGPKLNSRPDGDPT
jgi:hypothetical protein